MRLARHTRLSLPAFGEGGRAEAIAERGRVGFLRAETKTPPRRLADARRRPSPKWGRDKSVRGKAGARWRNKLSRGCGDAALQVNRTARPSSAMPESVVVQRWPAAIGKARVTVPV